ncbi:PREDICTED: mas-related G-protein coupled receptor MRG-like [Galeopterus variegatus]|uniref:Mas-related G-protein coupled receptor MRG-like n=1 Tax=Galeopterus variegatus TaxID=482537 RepID=A0ABM0RN71_GALVR|nr:PREDICTED: mas-related G-protein coupled receptor MRG-like [Galeopterus variegatus]
MARLPASLSWELDLDNETETTGLMRVNGTGSEWPGSQQAVLPITVAVALCGVVGNGAVCWLLCCHTPGSPHAACVLNLVASDILSLSCIAGILLEKVLMMYHKVTWHVVVVPEAVSYFSDMVGLSPGGMGTESSLCVLLPTCSRHRRPRHTSAVVGALSWGPALPSHAVNEVCDYWQRGLACEPFHEGFGIFHGLLSLVIVVSSLTLTIQSLCCPQGCSPTRICHGVSIVAITFLFWVLPLAVIMHLPEQEYLSRAFDLLLLLSSVVGVAHPAIYFLAGYLWGKRSRESLKVALQRVPMSELEAWRERGCRAQGPQETPASELRMSNAPPLTLPSTPDRG